MDAIFNRLRFIYRKFFIYFPLDHIGYYKISITSLIELLMPFNDGDLSVNIFYILEYMYVVTKLTTWDSLHACHGTNMNK